MSASDDQRIGPYRVLKQVAMGGMGAVYLAEDPRGRPVAVKLLHAMLAADEASLSRLRREVATMKRAQHPHLAAIIDADPHADPPYVVTEFVPGRTLHQTVIDDGPLSLPELLRLARDLAEALSAIHAAGVIHRDLTPGNIILRGGEMDPVVIDFGLARIIDTESVVTAPRGFVGTATYLAPEVIEGGRVGPASDVFSWAGTLVFAATGRTPFHSDSVPATFYGIINGEPDLRNVPGALLPLLKPAFAKNPANRPTPQALATALGRLEKAKALATSSFLSEQQAVGIISGTLTPHDAQRATARGIPGRLRRFRRLWSLFVRGFAKALEIPSGRYVPSRQRPFAAARIEARLHEAYTRLGPPPHDDFDVSSRPGRGEV